MERLEGGWGVGGGGTIRQSLLLQFAVCRYVEGVSGRGEEVWRLTDELEGREWGEQVEGKEFVFFPVRLVLVGWVGKAGVSRFGG